MTYQYRSADQALGSSVPVSSVSYTPRSGMYRDVVKRVLDIVLVLAVSVPVALTVAILAILVGRDGGSPFYVQERVGKDGRTFRMWKLRTMVANAEAVLDDYLAQDPAAKAEWDHHQKLRNDPRITRLGRILRKTSLDELPQLWNVLKGDMSIVGPRPMMLCQRVMYPGTEYYAMRPGVTGPWQVSDRQETSFGERAVYDRQYLSEMSLKTDLTLMLKTVTVVLKPNGC